MTFDDLLEQTLALLQRRGRVTYRALKRQFQLEDDVLDDLKEELIYGQRVASDEDGRVLVWTAGGSAPAASMAAPSRREGAEADQQPSPVEPHASGAERRHLTVLFCDLREARA